MDINFVNQRPAKYAECDQYLSDTNARRMAACEFGRDEAERMADRYGGGHGRIQGYLRGLAWGLHKMEGLTENDAASIAAGEQLVDGMGSYMQAGIDAGRRDGSTAGTSRGKSDAIDRFVAVLNTGRNPDPTVRIPATNYQGEDNAYQTYVGQVPTPASLLQNDLHEGAIPVYSDPDALFLGDVQPVNFWDLLFDDGTYRFQKDQWYDQNLAIQAWLKLPIDTKPKYNNLNNPPLLDAAGAAIDLQAVFQKAFVDSYAWYINYYYSSTFKTNMDLGEVAGEDVGTQLGKRVAQYKGLVAAFNRKFKESSAASYRDAFTGTYTSNFGGVFADYLNNPQLSIGFESVIGAVSDGIIQPGEEIAALFSVKNLGGVGSALNVSLSGDVINASTQTLSIGRLVSTQLTTQLIAEIDPRLRPRDTAKLLLHVNGITDDLNQEVFKMLAVNEVKPIVNVSAGAGEIHVLTQNVSTVRTPGLVAVTLKINGRDVATAQAGFIEAGDTEESVLAFSGIDPLALISGQESATITVTMGGAPTDQADASLTPANPDLALAVYFNDLANGKGLVPAHVAAQDRINDVASRITQIDDDETRKWRSSGPNLWRTSPDDTMIGKVVTQLRSIAQSQPARDDYDQLAHQLWPSRKNLRSFLFIKGPKRSHFEKLCKELSKTGKL